MEDIELYEPDKEKAQAQMDVLCQNYKAVSRAKDSLEKRITELCKEISSLLVKNPRLKIDLKKEGPDVSRS